MSSIESLSSQERTRDSSSIVCPERQPFYSYEETPKLTGLLSSIDAQKEDLQKISVYPLDLQERIREKLRVEWIYNSNAIEGSSLTLGQTIFFLQEGLTVEGKPFQDFLDARNHSEAIDYLYAIVRSERPITQTFVKEINALLLSGVSYTKAIDSLGRISKKPATAGQYKQLPNHVMKRDGTIHYYVEPLQVAIQMEELISWLDSHMDQLHPVVLASIAHYNMVRIHPFDDGNGRGARLLMNVLLMKHKYLPAIVEQQKRREYLSALQSSDGGNLGIFIEFIASSLFKTQESIIEVLREYDRRIGSNLGQK